MSNDQAFQLDNLLLEVAETARGETVGWGRVLHPVPVDQCRDGTSPVDSYSPVLCPAPVNPSDKLLEAGKTCQLPPQVTEQWPG